MRLERLAALGLLVTAGCTLALDYDRSQLRRPAAAAETDGAADVAPDAPEDVADVTADLREVCASGRGDCDNASANGCETDLTSDVSHCGTCGRACMGSMTCSGGACSPCRAPMIPCGMQCADTATDLRHCGACGVVCAPGDRCCQGVCRPRCL